MRVLLVEDDPSTQKSVKMMLESANMVVDTTDMGEDGLEIGKLYDYDIIVLDIMLPDMDGFETTRATAPTLGASPRPKGPSGVLT